MKILHFGRFYRREFGGIERHVELLMQGLAPHVQVDNVVAYPDGDRQVLHLNGGRVFTAASHGLIASIPISPQFPFLVRDLCRREHYDILHLHFPDPFSQFAVQAARASAKIVVTWHSDIIRQKALLQLYRPFLERFLFRADAIVAATPAHFSTSTQIPQQHLILQPQRDGYAPQLVLQWARATKQQFPLDVLHRADEVFESLVIHMASDGENQPPFAMPGTSGGYRTESCPRTTSPGHLLRAWQRSQLREPPWENRVSGAAGEPKALATALNALLNDDDLRARMGRAGQARVPRNLLWRKWRSATCNSTGTFY